MSSRTVDIRLATRDDLAGIGRLLPTLGGPSFPERFPQSTISEFCDWKYFQNPSGKALVGVASVGADLVSIVAATPKRIILES